MRKLISLVILSLAALFAEGLDADHFKNLKFRFIGPDGNRAIAVTGVSTDHDTYYVGAASGGLFRTKNNGISWQPIFDDQDVSSVSALALSQRNPNIIWAGTGETFVIRPAHAIGDGIYKSTDGGDMQPLWGTLMVRRKNGAFTAPPMAENRGNKSYSLMKIPAALILLWIETIRIFLSLLCGKSILIHGD